MFKDFVKGAGYLPGFGDNPGTSMVILFTVVGAIAGCHGEEKIIGMLAGAGIMLLVFGPLWAWGCIDRAREWYRWEKKNG